MGASTRQPIDGRIAGKVPDEFYQWVRATIDEFWETYRKLEAEAKAEYKESEDRKATAFYFQTCKYPAILFKMYEKRPYDTIIWKLLKPRYEMPFRNIEIEE